MTDTEKPIVVSVHAAKRMRQRGATQVEVERAILTETRQSAQRGKWYVRQQIPFNAVSPVNNRHYDFKIVEAVFADDPDKITVVTVKVYYHN